MGQILSFTVTTFDDAHPGGHRLADFARLDPAIRAAKLALDDHRVTMAVVKDRDGALVFAADRTTDWSGGYCPRCGGKVVQGRTPDEAYCGDCGLDVTRWAG